MRVAGDGHGDEPWEGPAGASTDNEATRVFTRSEYAPAAAGEGDDATRSFPHEPGASGADGAGPHPAPESGGEATMAFPRDPAAGATRAFSRDEFPPRPGGPGADDTVTGAQGAAEEASFTRRFVRDRPAPRGRAPRTGPDPLSDPDTAPDAGPGPGPGPGADPEPERAPRPPARPRRRRPRRRVRKRWIVTLLLLAALAVPPATWGWVWYTARQDDRTPSDAIVVLGASQYNGVPSPVFEARLRQAQELYLEGVAPVIVTVGGKLPDDNFTEAASGRNWLVEVGVPADSVVAVEEGSDTLQSMSAVSEVFDTNGWETAILVSDPWHSLRSQQMADDFGIEAGASPARSGPAVIERRTQLWYITRETASLWYYWIFNDSSDIRVNAA
ncbi:YdcF family protein [Nocardiopsis sp. YSL2]|uniref:YdcF family protein n=1 Tax=Nocardiopsis sp. YSL2 TaxID=2939492 RepID=UPI0026F415C5|nr:ElyC/SanA/YdcF family protein [Nocardiopsis sp. YSL2]